MTEPIGRIAARDEDPDDMVRRVGTDRQAFAALYDRFYPKILSYCSRRLYTPSVSEDLTGDVFLTAAQTIGGFRGQTEAEFAGWLYTIATNRINEYLRKNERRQRLLDDAVQSRRIGLTETHDRIDHLDWPTVYEAILRLKPRDQTLITLRYMEGLPHERIAAIVDLKASAVRVAISRAIDKLRKQFNNETPSGPKGASK